MADAEKPIAQDSQASLNAELWSRGDFVDFYATSELRAVEKVLLERHRDALSGRVLELGSGAGRLTGHLCELAQVVHGLELSPAMVAYCNRTYPKALVSEGDLRDLSRFELGSFEAVFAPYNVLDVLGQADRELVLDEIHRVLTPGGLLLLSTHNRGYSPRISMGLRVCVGSPRHPLQSLRALPRRLRNRRRMRPLERAEERYALRNDEAHDFSLLHYYISRDAQYEQLRAHGFEPVECLDLDGREVGPGGKASHCSEFHFAARSAPAAQPGV
jgi:SAM-dependent methyltransferase